MRALAPDDAETCLAMSSSVRHEDRDMVSTVIRQLRIVGLIEGVSFLVLLGIAMPLKYLAGMPRAVSVVGMVHGVLFILYALAAFHAWVTARWSLGRGAALVAASVLPFGTFVLDARLRREQNAATAEESRGRAAAA
jgi:integral membrane protein